jgi:hypothetical protein
MSPWLAATILTWVALLLLYLGLAATLRKVNVLSAELAALRSGGNATASGVALRLPGLAKADAPSRRLVLAADTFCPACHIAVEALDDLASRMDKAPLLLTYEEPEVWQSATNLRVHHDPESWRRLASLSPPVLMVVDATGQVTEVALPTMADDIPRTLAGWGMMTAVTERSQR